VDGVKAIGVHVEWEAARATDAADHDEIFARHTEFGEGALERVKDGVIAAARAPAHFVRRNKVLAAQFRDGWDVFSEGWLDSSVHGD